MNNPVSFELAKLLKEKGFDLSTEGFYPKPKCKLFGVDEHGRYYPIVNKTRVYFFDRAAVLKEENYYNAPTFVEVVMWLYEKHGIWIYSFRHDFDKEFYWSIDTKNEDEFTSDMNFNSPTEAYEAAIEYVLKNLI